MRIFRKILKHSYLKASSLIEALFALVILIIITSFILLIMNNVNNRSNVGLKTRAFNEVNNAFNRSINEKDYSERTLDFKNFSISCQVFEYVECEKLMVFRVTALSNNGKIILSKQRLVEADSNRKIISNEDK